MPNTFTDEWSTDLGHSTQVANTVNSIIAYQSDSLNDLSEQEQSFFHCLLQPSDTKNTADIGLIHTAEFFTGNLFITNGLKNFYRQYCTTPQTQKRFCEAYNSSYHNDYRGLQLLFGCILQLKVLEEFDSNEVCSWLGSLHEELTTTANKTLMITDASQLFKYYIARANQSLLFDSSEVSAKYFIYLTQIFDIMDRSYNKRPLYQDCLADIIVGRRTIDQEYIANMRQLILE